jgi:hypothetical protein
LVEAPEPGLVLEPARDVAVAAVVVNRRNGAAAVVAAAAIHQTGTWPRHCWLSVVAVASCNRPRAGLRRKTRIISELLVLES